MTRPSICRVVSHESIAFDVVHYHLYKNTEFPQLCSHATLSNYYHPSPNDSNPVGVIYYTMKNTYEYVISNLSWRCGFTGRRRHKSPITAEDYVVTHTLILT